MPKRPQHYYRPSSMEEALSLLTQPNAAPLAGGTRLLANDIEPDRVVDLQALGLDGITHESGELRIGAMTRLADIENHDIPNGELLKLAVYRAGPNTFRNAATLGGVIGSREPDSELLALLLAMEAALVFADRDSLSLADYLTPDERPKGLITEIHVPWAGGIGSLERVARTPADSPIVSVAVWKTSRIMVGASGISPRPTLVDVNHLQVTHPGDFRGSTAYRQEMLTVLLRRALEKVSSQGSNQ